MSEQTFETEVRRVLVGVSKGELMPNEAKAALLAAHRAELAAVEAERDGYIKECHFVEQTLGEALGGFPSYADDPKNFPGATKEDGVCNPYTPGETAILAAKEIARLRHWKQARTCRGFAAYSCVDTYGQTCSVQQSSLANRNALWVGADDEPVRDKVTGTTYNNRMHLSPAQARELAYLIGYWGQRGELPMDTPRARKEDR